MRLETKLDSHEVGTMHLRLWFAMSTCEALGVCHATVRCEKTFATKHQVVLAVRTAMLVNLTESRPCEHGRHQIAYSYVAPRQSITLRLLRRSVTRWPRV